MDLIDIHLAKKFPVICIDGGACSGKSTGMPILMVWLESIGRTPRVVPESATIFMESGFRPGKDGMSNFEFQRQLLYFNIEKENRTIQAAMRLPEAEKVVVLCDRGTMNAEAYMSPDEFRSLIMRENLSLVELRDKRYDAIIHLRTAALGAEKHYRTNNVRKETPEQARELDQRTLDAWVGAPHLYVIDNHTNFKEKIERLKRVVAHIIGYPEPREMEKKFLVTAITPDAIPVRSETVHIMQMYLRNDTCAERIRVRSQATLGSTYYHTKKQGNPGNVLETEQQISEREFRALTICIADGTKFLGKNRTCFVWNERYYELDAFDWPLEGLFLLEAERLYPRERIEIPPFIHVIKDVSRDPFYSNYHLARM